MGELNLDPEDQESTPDSWMHYLVVGAGLVFGFGVVVIIFEIILSVWRAGVVPFLITGISLWFFFWIITLLVRIGRRNGWFNWMDDEPSG